MASNRIFRNRWRKKSQRGIQHCHVHHLTFFSVRALIKSTGDCERRRHSANSITHSKACSRRSHRLVASQRHYPTHCLDFTIVSGRLTVRTVMTKTGNGAVDNLWVDLLKGIISQTQTIHHTRSKILHDHIRFSNKFLANLDGCWIF